MAKITTRCASCPWYDGLADACGYGKLKCYWSAHRPGEKPPPFVPQRKRGPVKGGKNNANG